MTGIVLISVNTSHVSYKVLYSLNTRDSCSIHTLFVIANDETNSLCISFGFFWMLESMENNNI